MPLSLLLPNFLRSTALAPVVLLSFLSGVFKISRLPLHLRAAFESATPTFPLVDVKIKKGFVERSKFPQKNVGSKVT